MQTAITNAVSSIQENFHDQHTIANRIPLNMNATTVTLCCALLSIIAVSSVYGIASTTVQGILCYSCQWSSKDSYTDPYSQACLTNEIQPADPKPGNSVHQCIPGAGCQKVELYQGSTLIGITRSCAAVTAVMLEEKMYCRGGDCSANTAGTGTALAGTAGGAVPCRTVAAGSSEADITATAVTASCSTDTATQYVYCTRQKTTTNAVVDGFPAAKVSPSYTLACERLPKTFWTASVYTRKSYTCVESFCNGPSSATQLKVSLVPLLLALVAKCLN